MLEPEPEPEPLAAPVDEWTVVQRKPVKAGKKKKKARGRRQAGGKVDGGEPARPAPFLLLVSYQDYRMLRSSS